MRAFCENFWVRGGIGTGERGSMGVRGEGKHTRLRHRPRIGISIEQRCLKGLQLSGGALCGSPRDLLLGFVLCKKHQSCTTILIFRALEYEGREERGERPSPTLFVLLHCERGAWEVGWLRGGGGMPDFNNEHQKIASIRSPSLFQLRLFVIIGYFRTSYHYVLELPRGNLDAHAF